MVTDMHIISFIQFHKVFTYPISVILSLDKTSIKSGFVNESRGKKSDRMGIFFVISSALKYRQPRAHFRVILITFRERWSLL